MTDKEMTMNDIYATENEMAKGQLLERKQGDNLMADSYAIGGEMSEEKSTRDLENEIVEEKVENKTNERGHGPYWDEETRADLPPAGFTIYGDGGQMTEDRSRPRHFGLGDWYQQSFRQKLANRCSALAEELEAAGYGELGITLIVRFPGPGNFDAMVTNEDEVKLGLARALQLDEIPWLI
jgi:hypothetical protein